MQNKRKSLVSSLLLLIAAVLWGGSFVAQSSGGSLIGPFSMGCMRFGFATLAMLPLILILSLKNKGKNQENQDKKTLIKGGILCGLCLSVTAIFQQLGMYYGTPSGKAGFLTACYIIFVPLLSIFFRKKPKINMWIAVVVAIVGLYFLCITDGFSAQVSDLLVLICSIGCAMRILVIDKFMNRVDVIKLACIQFATASIVTGILMVIFEIGFSAEGLAQWAEPFANSQVWVAILYSGIAAGAFAFTLQNIGQKNVNPTLSSLILSLESVFSVLAGWLLLHDTLSTRELVGCAIVFAAIVIAELPIKSREEKKLKAG